MKTKTTFTGIVLMLTLAFIIPLDSFGQGKGTRKGPPAWAPAHGYRAKTRHIYFPDHNFYFDLQKNEYIYLKGDKWQVDVRLPRLYAGIDLKGAARVELELNIDSPQNFNLDHIAKYKAKAKGGQIKIKINNDGKVNKGGPNKGKGLLK